MSYVYGVKGDSIEHLDSDLEFYTRFVFKPLSGTFQSLNALAGLPYVLHGCYFPWNRTFEIGFNVPL